MWYFVTKSVVRLQFDMMESEQMVQSMVCVYNQRTQQFHTIVKVGRDVCGYPRTVHGGLTAAIADETFGGMLKSFHVCVPDRTENSATVCMQAAGPIETS
jgi:hypothetical protein